MGSAEGQIAGQWDCITLDPPWNERGGGKSKRGADKHYDLLKTKDMPGVILNSGVFRPANNCHVYMWVTKNHLKDGLWLMGELGVTYKTTITWVKTRKDTRGNRMLLQQDSPVHAAMGRGIANGIGQYFRGATELILFGTVGRGFAVRSDARNLPDVVFAPPARHSEKPAAARRLIEARTVHPGWETRRLEMFARVATPGWTAWGREAPDVDPRDG